MSPTQLFFQTESHVSLAAIPSILSVKASKREFILDSRVETVKPVKYTGSLSTTGMVEDKMFTPAPSTSANVFCTASKVRSVIVACGISETSSLVDNSMVSAAAFLGV